MRVDPTQIDARFVVWTVFSENVCRRLVALAALDDDELEAETARAGGLLP